MDPWIPSCLQFLEYPAHQVGGVNSPVAFVGNVVQLEFLPAHFAAGGVESIEVDVPVLACVQLGWCVKFYGRTTGPLS